MVSPAVSAGVAMRRARTQSAADDGMDGHPCFDAFSSSPSTPERKENFMARRKQSFLGFANDTMSSTTAVRQGFTKSTQLQQRPAKKAPDEQRADFHLQQQERVTLLSHSNQTNARNSSSDGAAFWRRFTGVQAGSKTRQPAPLDRLQPPSKPGYTIIVNKVGGRKTVNICLSPASNHVGAGYAFPLHLTVPCPACQSPPPSGPGPRGLLPSPVAARHAHQPSKGRQDTTSDSSKVAADTTPTTSSSRGRSAAPVLLSPLSKDSVVNVPRDDRVKRHDPTFYFPEFHSVTTAQHPASDPVGEEEGFITAEATDIFPREDDTPASGWATCTSTAPMAAAQELVPEVTFQTNPHIYNDDGHPQQPSCSYCCNTGHTTLQVSTISLPRFCGGVKTALLWGLYYRLAGAKQTLLWSHDSGTDIGYLHQNFMFLSHYLRVNILVYDYSGYGCSTHHQFIPRRGALRFCSNRRTRLLSRQRFFSGNATQKSVQELQHKQQRHQQYGAQPEGQQQQGSQWQHQDLQQQQQALQWEHQVLQQQREEQPQSGTSSLPLSLEDRPCNPLPGSPPFQQQIITHVPVLSGRNISTGGTRSETLQQQQQTSDQDETPAQPACTGELSCSIVDIGGTASVPSDLSAANASPSFSYFITHASTAAFLPLCQQQDGPQRPAAALGEAAAKTSPPVHTHEVSTPKENETEKPMTLWSGKQIGKDAAAAYHWLVKKEQLQPSDIIVCGEGLGVAATLLLLKKLARQQKRVEKRIQRTYIFPAAFACPSYTDVFQPSNGNEQRLCTEPQLLQSLSSEAAPHQGGETKKCRLQHKQNPSGRESRISATAAAAAPHTEKIYPPQQQEQPQQLSQQQHHQQEQPSQQQSAQQQLQQQEHQEKGRRDMKRRRRLRVYVSLGRTALRRQKEKRWIRRRVRKSMQQIEKRHVRKDSLLLSDEEILESPGPASRGCFIKKKISSPLRRLLRASTAAAADPAELCSLLLGGVMLLTSTSQLQQQQHNEEEGRLRAAGNVKEALFAEQDLQQQKQEGLTKRKYLPCTNDCVNESAAAFSMPFSRNSCCQWQRYRCTAAAPRSCSHIQDYHSKSCGAGDATIGARCSDSDSAVVSSSSCCFDHPFAAAGSPCTAGSCCCHFSPCACEGAESRAEFVCQKRNLKMRRHFYFCGVHTLEKRIQRMSAAPLLLLQSALFYKENNAVRLVSPVEQQTRDLTTTTAAGAEATGKLAVGGGTTGATAATPTTAPSIAATPTAAVTPTAAAATPAIMGDEVPVVSVHTCSTASTNEMAETKTYFLPQPALSFSSCLSSAFTSGGSLLLLQQRQHKWWSTRRQGMRSSNTCSSNTCSSNTCSSNTCSSNTCSSNTCRSNTYSSNICSSSRRSSCANNSFAAAQMWLVQRMQEFLCETAVQHQLLRGLCMTYSSTNTLESNEEEEKQKKKAEVENEIFDGYVLYNENVPNLDKREPRGKTAGFLKKEQQKKEFLIQKRKKRFSAVPVYIDEDDEADTAAEEEGEECPRTGGISKKTNRHAAAARECNKVSISRLLTSSSRVELKRSSPAARQRGDFWETSADIKTRKQQQEYINEEEQQEKQGSAPGSNRRNRFFPFRRKQSVCTDAAASTAACGETAAAGGRTLSNRWLAWTGGKPGKSTNTGAFLCSIDKTEDAVARHESTTLSVAGHVSSSACLVHASRCGEDASRRDTGDPESSSDPLHNSSNALHGSSNISSSSKAHNSNNNRMTKDTFSGVVSEGNNGAEMRQYFFHNRGDTHLKFEEIYMLQQTPENSRQPADQQDLRLPPPSLSIA